MLIITTLVFVGILMAGNLLFWSSRAREESRNIEISRRLGTLSDHQMDSLFRDNGTDPLAESLGSFGLRLDGMLREANASFTLNGLLGRCAFVGIIGAILTSILIRGPIGLIGLGAGIIPLIRLSARADERALALSEQLPDGLDLIGRSLQAGHGLSDAMRLCAQEMDVPLAFEFGRVYEEHNLGRDMRECLNDLCRRNPRNFDLRIFVSSVILQRETGGNLIEILSNISKTIRNRFVFQRKVRSLTAEARISAYILGGMPFVVALILMVIRPEYLQPLIQDPIGHNMLFFCIASFSLGVLSMRHLSQIEM